jgi:hypothetical protein
MIIEDGTGTGKKTKVDSNNRLHTDAVQQTRVQLATGKGSGYNINTGDVVISGSTTLLYVKTNEDTTLIVDALAVGLSRATVGEIGKINLYRNPTTGSIVARAADVPVNANRNFGSNKTLDADAYVGADADTNSGGALAAQFYQGSNSRLFATIDFHLTKGDSLAIEVVPDFSGSSVDVRTYVALVCHLQDVADTE